MSGTVSAGHTAQQHLHGNSCISPHTLLCIWQGGSDSSDEDAEGPDEYDLNDNFIAGDEDEDEGGDRGQAEEKRRKRARKRSREEEQLDEDDYQLLQEAVSLGRI